MAFDDPLQLDDEEMLVAQAAERAPKRGKQKVRRKGNFDEQVTTSWIMVAANIIAWSVVLGLAVIAWFQTAGG